MINNSFFSNVEIQIFATHTVQATGLANNILSSTFEDISIVLKISQNNAVASLIAQQIINSSFLNSSFYFASLSNIQTIYAMGAQLTNVRFVGCGFLLEGISIVKQNSLFSDSSINVSLTDGLLYVLTTLSENFTLMQQCSSVTITDLFYNVGTSVVNIESEECFQYQNIKHNIAHFMRDAQTPEYYIVSGQDLFINATEIEEYSTNQS